MFKINKVLCGALLIASFGWYNNHSSVRKKDHEVQCLEKFSSMVWASAFFHTLTLTEIESLQKKSRFCQSTDVHPEIVFDGARSTNE
jgi:hypothetical protein